MALHKILFVCMGNICRSPTAEGVFSKLVNSREMQSDFEIDSAGTGDWHTGNPPDSRAQQAALVRGIDLSSLRARQVEPEDIVYYDLVIAMDNDNLSRLKSMSQPADQHKVKLLLEYGTSNESEVPDPYYGGEHGFDIALDLIEDACQGLLDSLADA